MNPTQAPALRARRWSTAVGALLAVAALASCTVTINGAPPAGGPVPAPSPAPEVSAAAAADAAAVDFDAPPGWRDAEPGDLALPPQGRVERRVVDDVIDAFEPNIMVLSEEKSPSLTAADYAEGFQGGVLGQPGQDLAEEPAGTPDFDGVEGTGFSTSGPVPGSDQTFVQEHVVLERDDRIYYVSVSDVRGPEQAQETMDGVRRSWEWR
jgi:hypothetical protein